MGQGQDHSVDESFVVREPFVLRLSLPMAEQVSIVFAKARTTYLRLLEEHFDQLSPFPRIGVTSYAAGSIWQILPSINYTQVTVEGFVSVGDSIKSPQRQLKETFEELFAQRASLAVASAAQPTPVDLLDLWEPKPLLGRRVRRAADVHVERTWRENSRRLRDEFTTPLGVRFGVIGHFSGSIVEEEDSVPRVDFEVQIVNGCPMTTESDLVHASRIIGSFVLK